MAHRLTVLRNLAKRGDLVAEELKYLRTLYNALDVPVWEDLRGDVSQGTGPAALTYEEFRDAGFKLFFFRHNQADELNFVFQMPHGWDPATEVRPHLHIVPMANPAGPQTIALSIKYAWSRPEHDPLPANAGWTTGSASHVVQPGDVYKQTVISLGHITPPAWAVESTVLCIQAVRNVAVDTYETGKDHGTAAANVALLSFDVHYRKGKLGTVSEFPDAGD